MIAFGSQSFRVRQRVLVSSTNRDQRHTHNRSDHRQNATGNNAIERKHYVILQHLSRARGHFADFWKQSARAQNINPGKGQISWRWARRTGFVCC
jgi:hypothetical protein